MISDLDLLPSNGLRALPAKPADTSSRDAKKTYSEGMSECIALAFAGALRHRGLKGTMPDPSAVSGRKGSERRMAGGLGAKNVDVTWATEESGLILSVSVKSINFRDSSTGNYQKNLTNRRGDMLYEAATLHSRFPYAVLAGFIFLDRGARDDGTTKRHSTFRNAHTRFRMFTGRNDPAGRAEQYERLYIVLVEAGPEQTWYEVYRVGEPEQPIGLEQAFGELLELVAERNPDFYEVVDGKIQRAG